MTEELKKEFSKLRFLDENGGLYPEWEEKKYENFLKISQEKPSESVDLNKLITVGWWGKGLTHSTKGAIFKEGATNFYPRREGQLVYSKQNLYKGAIDLVSSDFDGYLSSKDNPAFDFYGNSVDNRFILMFMLRPSYYKGLEKFSSGTGSKRVSEKIVLSMTLTLPSLSEQTKIANFLSKIDEKIEVQSSLVELLKKQKQGYSQKIFNGSLRFKKDDGTDYDDWEETKLGELVDYNSKIKQLSANELEEMKNDANEVKLLPSSKNYNWTTDVETAKGFITNKEVFTMGKARYANLKYVNGPFVSSNNVVLSSNNIDRALTKFLMMIVINNIEEFYVDGTTYPKFSKTNLDNFKINLPSLPEQEKIAAFLTSLDNRIDEELNILEQLKLEKNGYMQRVLA